MSEPHQRVMDTYYSPMIHIEYTPVTTLRQRCDAYYHPCYSVNGERRTFFNLKKVYEEDANLCLKCFNEKNGTNFALEEIVKLNQHLPGYYLTFKGRDAGTGDTRYFRGAVELPNGKGEPQVLLCEIKDDGEVGLEIPPGHDDYYCPWTPFSCLLSNPGDSAYNDDVDHISDHEKDEQAAPKHKGKISRFLAAKDALAIRCDALGDSEDNSMGLENRAKLEARLRNLEGKELGRLAGSAKGKPKIEVYDKDGKKGSGGLIAPAKAYNPAADSTLGLTKMETVKAKIEAIPMDEHVTGEEEKSKKKKKKRKHTELPEEEGSGKSATDEGTANEKKKKKSEHSEPEEETKKDVHCEKKEKKKKKQIE